MPRAAAGTPADPYLIYNSEQLNVISSIECDWDRHFKLMADIDLSARIWLGPVIRSFAGTFNGNGYAISHLTITGKDDVGFFGRLVSGAEVTDFGVVDVNISGANYVGGLAGRNDGTLIRCAIAGEINGTSHVGGLAGHNNGTMAECTSAGTAGGTGDWVGGLVGDNVNGVVTGCYNTGPISGNQFVGGLVGYNSGGTVTHSYSTGPVSGNSFVGGAVGYNDRGSVTQCYSIGPAHGGWYVGGLMGTTYFGIVSNSFWDTQTSGQTTSFGGIGKTTAEVKTAKTFLDAGWDFVGETKNGTEDLWWILEGKGYPRLWWEAHN